MKPAVVVAAFVICSAITTGETSLGTSTAKIGKGSNPVNPSHSWISAQHGRERSDERSCEYDLPGPPSSSSVKLNKREMSEIAITVQDTKDTVQGILWIANILMGQLYEIFIN